MTRLIVVSADDLRTRLERLEADRETWLALIARYDSLEYGLERDIEAIRWQLGDRQRSQP